MLISRYNQCHMTYKILIVEDEPSIADTLIYALAQDNIESTHVLLGADALQAFTNNPPTSLQPKSQPYDLVILDVGLPDIKGFEVFKKLRTYTQVPICF